MKPLIKNPEQQLQLKNAIKTGKNLILTADTGAGKSVVTTALLAELKANAIIGYASCEPYEPVKVEE